MTYCGYPNETRREIQGELRKYVISLYYVGDRGDDVYEFISRNGSDSREHANCYRTV